MTEGVEEIGKKHDIIRMSDFLFARPSVLEGIGRNIDIFGVLNCYNKSQTARETDIKAMKNDLEALKQDFEIAYGKVINGNQRKER